MTHLAMISASASIERWVPDAVFAFADGLSQARDLAEKCRAQLGECEVHVFPDGETLVTAHPNTSLSGKVVALYRSLHDPNVKLIELLFAANAIRSLGAAKIILIAPYLPYMRQDRAFASGQAVSQQALGQILAPHFDAVVTVQPHLHRTSSLSSIFLGKPALALGAGHAIARHMKIAADPFSVVLGPDEESEPLVRAVVDVLGTSWCVGSKQRHGDRDVTIELPANMEIKGRPAVIVDDIVSSGGTVIRLASTLKQAGADRITVYAVHALFDQRAAFLMQRAGVTQVFSLNSVPHVTNAIPVVDVICSGLGVKS